MIWEGRQVPNWSRWPAVDAARIDGLATPGGWLEPAGGGWPPERNEVERDWVCPVGGQRACRSIRFLSWRPVRGVRVKRVIDSGSMLPARVQAAARRPGATPHYPALLTRTLGGPFLAPESSIWNQFDLDGRRTRPHWAESLARLRSEGLGCEVFQNWARFAGGSPGCGKTREVTLTMASFKSVSPF